MNRLTRKTASNRVIDRRRGMVSEYMVATDRKASSTEWDRSSSTPEKLRPRSRYFFQAMKTTIVQPTPMSSRLAPVMLARARAQGDSLPAAAWAADWQAMPYSLNDSPPLTAK